MKKWEACLFKRAYETEAEAQVQGCTVYMCIFCGKYHRATDPKARREPKFVSEKRFMKKAAKRFGRAWA